MDWNAKNNLSKAMTWQGLNMGERTRTFLKGLRWMLPVALITRVLTGLAGVAVARILGPTNFGLVSLVLAATLWIQIPLFVGMPISLMHYIPGADHDKKPTWTAIGCVLLTGSIGLTLLIGILGAPTWAQMLKIPVQAFRWGLFWSGGFAVFTAATSLANAWEKFHWRAGLDLLFTVLYLGLIAAFYFTKKLTPLTYLLCLTLGYASSGILGMVSYVRRKDFRLDPESRPMAKRILSYGLIASLGNIVNALLYSAGRLVANRYLVLSEVGILSAYQAGTLQVSVFLVSVISQAFFPLASRTPDKSVLLRKLNRVILLIIGPLVVALMLAVLLYFKILGKHYPFSWSVAAIYVVAAVFTLLCSLFDWFLASGGRKGMLLSSIVGIIAGTVNWGMCLYCIPRWNVLGAGMASLLAGMIGLILFEIVAFRTMKNSASSKREALPA